LRLALDTAHRGARRLSRLQVAPMAGEEESQRGKRRARVKEYQSLGMSHCACIFADGAMVESCKYHGARDAEIAQLRASLNRVNDDCLRAEQERDRLRAEVERLKAVMEAAEIRWENQMCNLKAQLLAEVEQLKNGQEKNDPNRNP